MDQKLAVITGGSSGIGLAIAEKAAQNNYNLLIIAHNKKKLDEAQQKLMSKYPEIEVLKLSVDLSKPQSPKDVINYLQKEQMSPDIFVNNAGFGVRGKLHQADLNKQLSMIDVNIRALTYFTYLVLPLMKDKKGSHILNVASTAAFSPLPGMAVYGASKAYVLSLSEAIASEYRDSAVQIHSLCPGPTITAFIKRAEMQNTGLFKNGTMTATEVAEIAWQGMQKNKRVIVPGWRNKLLQMLQSILPNKIVSSISENLVS